VNTGTRAPVSRTSTVAFAAPHESPLLRGSRLFYNPHSLEEVSLMIRRQVPRLTRWGLLIAALGLVAGGHAAFGQGRGGSIVFVSRRPPRDMVGNIRAWASSNRATSYSEDTSQHNWRVNFMAFFDRAPNAAEITLSWFHVQGRGPGVYVTNEPIAMGNPTDRIFFHTTTLRRAPGEFEPMERYEAVLTVNDARGARNLARGTIQLTGQLERRNGVVDFTGSTPTAN
jgi:hypothetical protein